MVDTSPKTTGVTELKADSTLSASGHADSSPAPPTAVMGTYNRYPLTLVSGRGGWVRDHRGDRYLDAVAGIATCTLGHSNRAMRRALSDQLRRLQHVSNLYEIPEQEKLARWLVSHSCADSVFFCNSGAEANEAAIKLARKHGHQRKNIERPVILTAAASFHGRTLAAVSATGQPRYHVGFEPMVEGFETFAYNNLNSFENLLIRLEADGPRVCAVLIEPLQGEGGVNPGDPEIFRAIRRHCDQRNILLIFDEVQVGMGRSGRLWGYEQLDVQPDVITLAKGLGGGHAIGALLTTKQADLFTPGDHASTFGGNPFACRAGLTVAHELERRQLLRNVSERGEQLNTGLQKLIQRFPQQLLEARGWGLLQGLVIRDDCDLNAADVVKAALAQKLLLVPAGTKVVRMVPPLVIDRREVAQLLTRLERALNLLNA